MKIAHEFTVSAPAERAWEVLTDLEGIVPCMPGAMLTGLEGDSYLGKVKVKLGPVTSEFSGAAQFVEKDDTTHRAVINAKGRDVRGAGNASALITMGLRADEERTVVSVETDLKLVGKLAQFGSGMIQEVSTKLLGEFVGCLEQRLTETPRVEASTSPRSPGGDGSGGTASEPAVAAGAAVAPAAAAAPPMENARPEPEALDLMQYAGGALARRLVPVAIGVIVVVAVVGYLLARG